MPGKPVRAAGDIGVKPDIPFRACLDNPSVFGTRVHEMEKHMPAVSPENICLDSAMDNYPTYRLLKKKQIRAFIDLNNKCGRPKTIPDTDNWNKV